MLSHYPGDRLRVFTARFPVLCIIARLLACYPDALSAKESPVFRLERAINFRSRGDVFITLYMSTVTT